MSASNIVGWFLLLFKHLAWWWQFFCRHPFWA